MKLRRLLRSPLTWLGAVIVLLAAGVLALGLRQKPAPAETSRAPALRFLEITEQSGVKFVHFNGATGRKFLPETMGSGVAIIDFDDDGLPDLLFVNSCPWPGQAVPSPRPTLALYRNLGGGQFEDVTVAAGLDVTMYGMGVTVGDFDNDGFPDVFITGVGGNRLFQNVKATDGKGANGRRFVDVTASAGVGGPGGWPGRDGNFSERKAPLCWSTSASFLDYDGDGRLDLFVCNYVVWSPADDHKRPFQLRTGERAYGPPRAFAGTQCFLYRNLGGGKFEDVSKQAGIQVWARPGEKEGVGKSLGVIVCDVDEDGWPDVVVANDTVRNFFFHNVPGSAGGRRFEEGGEWSGIAYADRHARGAMGIDWGPGYRAGRSALVIGNFADEPNTLLVADRPQELRFVDYAWPEGIAGPSKPLLKFGLFFFDYDLDGRLDLLTCNGHLEPDIARALPNQTYEQPVQLFWNTGESPRGFEVVTERSAGADLFRPLVGRGCAYADLDGDGHLDVVLTANGGRARVLRNEGGTGHHWVRLKLVGDGVRSNRSAIGARVVLEAGGTVQKREVAAGRGYLSQSELVLTFGLGASDRIDKVTIHWPGRNAGPPQVLTGLAIDREHRIEQGKKF
jgi:hypothetical protein